MVQKRTMRITSYWLGNEEATARFVVDLLGLELKTDVQFTPRQFEGEWEFRRLDGTPFTDAEIIATIMEASGVDAARAARSLDRHRQEMRKILKEDGFPPNGIYLKSDWEGLEMRAVLKEG